MNRIIFIIGILFSLSSFTFAQETVRPIQDSIGFCWNADEMETLMNYLSENYSEQDDNPGDLFAAISVHDDYLYAGNVYYPLYKNIHSKEVIIFGVTHGSVRKELGSQSNVLILDEFTRWKGPYKDVEISPLRDIIKSKLSSDYFKVSNRAHSIEHSIEALIPFLQYYNRGIKITPIMVTQMDLDRMEEISSKLSEIINDYIKSNNLQLGKDIFFLISNDANHYGEDFSNSYFGLDAAGHKAATENDRRIITKDLEGNINKDNVLRIAEDLWPDSSGVYKPLWCGRYPIVFGLKTILKISGDKEIEGRLYKYSDTFTEKVLPVRDTSMGLTAVFSYKHWCGWFTEGFYLGN